MLDVLLVARRDTGLNVNGLANRTNTQAIGVTAATFDSSGGIATVIGVAISASLLPPAVNCGMLWVRKQLTWEEEEEERRSGR